MASPLDRVIHAFSKLPGVGSKSAARIAFHLLRAPPEVAHELAEAVLGVKTSMQHCHRCLSPSPTDPCAICTDHRREQSQICVVEEPADLSAIEKSGAYRGTYHILHGCLSPLEGIGPDALKIQELLHRLRQHPIAEIILATNATVEGEATAAYVAGLLKPTGVHVTRLASGIPVGAEVEYVDPRTLAQAMVERRAV